MIDGYSGGVFISRRFVLIDDDSSGVFVLMDCDGGGKR